MSKKLVKKEIVNNYKVLYYKKTWYSNADPNLNYICLQNGLPISNGVDSLIFKRDSLGRSEYEIWNKNTADKAFDVNERFIFNKNKLLIESTHNTRNGSSNDQEYIYNDYGQLVLSRYNTRYKIFRYFDRKRNSKYKEIDCNGGSTFIYKRMPYRLKKINNN